MDKRLTWKRQRRLVKSSLIAACTKTGRERPHIVVDLRVDNGNIQQDTEVCYLELILLLEHDGIQGLSGIRTSRGGLRQVIVDGGKADAKGWQFLTIDVDHLAGTFRVRLGHL